MDTILIELYFSFLIYTCVYYHLCQRLRDEFTGLISTNKYKIKTYERINIC